MYIYKKDNKIVAASEIEYDYSEYNWVCEYTDEKIISVDGQLYKASEVPEPTPLTIDQIRNLRIQYRRDNIDDKTCERTRKMANNSWTDQEEQEYLALDAQVTAYIEENYPYPE